MSRPPRGSPEARKYGLVIHYTHRPLYTDRATSQIVNPQGSYSGSALSQCGRAAASLPLRRRITFARPAHGPGLLVWRSFADHPPLLGRELHNARCPAASDPAARLAFGQSRAVARRRAVNCAEYGSHFRVGRHTGIAPKPDCAALSKHADKVRPQAQPLSAQGSTHERRTWMQTWSGRHPGGACTSPQPGLWLKCVSAGMRA